MVRPWSSDERDPSRSETARAMVSQWSHRLHKAMNRFSSLLVYSSCHSPGEVQREAQKAFQERVRSSRLSLRTPSAPIPSTTRYVVIGVASYSVPDLGLLDVVESSAQAFDRASIAVFDATQCSSMDDFDRYIPGIGEVFQTPVVGVFVGGGLVDKATGLSQSETILKRLGLMAP